jgi:hypothetical protein
VRESAAGRAIAPGEVAWLLLGPALAIAAALIALLARPLGQVLFAPSSFHYWTSELVVPKPTVQAGYVLAVACVVGYACAIVLVRTRRTLQPVWQRGVVILTQVALLAFLAVAWHEQSDIVTDDTARPFFTLATVLVAAALAAAIAVSIGSLGRSGLPARLRAALGQASSSRIAAGVCLGVAAVLTVMWLLPVVYSDRNVAFATDDVQYLDRFFFDEATAVLNGRSPLVNMATYGAIWPYVTALPLSAFDGSFLGFSLLMATISGVALLALYDVLRRVTTHPPAALALYVPLLATSFFTIDKLSVPGAGEARYSPASYFGIWPLRYAGPYLLAWLTVCWIGRRRPRRCSTALLFGAAGLVIANNLEFGVAALGGTLAAAVCALRPLSGAQLRRLGRSVAVGLVAALGLVCAFTLVRAGSLPHVDVMTAYGRAFASGGYGNLALPALGFHLVLTATFVAAVATAAVRTRARDPELALTGMLAWSGVFGLGASIYFYGYRSHVFSVIMLFSAWAFALTLLVVAVVRASRRQRRWPTLPELAVLLAFGLAVCSIAQIPRPWEELGRLGKTAPEQPFRAAAAVADIKAWTKPGERVAIIDALGHRMAREAGVVSVTPYTGLEQIGAREQMEDVLDLLEREGGRRVFVKTPVAVPLPILEGAVAVLFARGYYVAKSQDGLDEYLTYPR